MTTIAYDDVLRLVRQLDRPTQARLIAEVVQELASTPVAHAAPAEDAWSRWIALGDDIRTHYPDMDIGEQLSADRQARATALTGRTEDDDVRP